MIELTSIQTWLQGAGYCDIADVVPVAGGSINRTAVISLVDGTSLFVKQHHNPPERFFDAEADGLDALNELCSLRVPLVVHADREFLLLENLGCGPESRHFWVRLGEGLAELHGKPQSNFGFRRDNYCGRTLQKNPPMQNGFEFFARHRLLHLASVAQRNGVLPGAYHRKIEYIATHLDQLLPSADPALIHGDLWSGNVHCDLKGQPALVDPACYWGWAEAELAMTTLFGEFPAEFYSSYEANYPIENDWRERAAIYNLYHLLNHLILFGESYLIQIKTAIKRFSN